MTKGVVAMIRERKKEGVVGGRKERRKLFELLSILSRTLQKSKKQSKITTTTISPPRLYAFSHSNPSAQCTNNPKCDLTRFSLWKD